MIFRTAAGVRPFSLQSVSKKRRFFSGEYTVFHRFGNANYFAQAIRVVRGTNNARWAGDFCDSFFL